RRGDDASRDVRDIRVGESEIRMIQDVEEFRAVLQLEPLRDCEVLRDRKIQILEGRPDDLVPARIALKAGGRELESRFVVPARGRWVIELSVIGSHGIDNPTPTRWYD